MEVQPLQNDRYRVFLTPDELEVFFECAPHHRAHPPFKLMTLSQRVSTAADVTPGQIFEKNGEYFMRVEGKDATDRYQETKPRNVWLPEPIYEEIMEFVKRENIADDESICDVGKRQLQNWVNTTAENAATATGLDDFEKVTAHDLRRYFGTHFLIRLGVDPQIVCQLGGWKSPENMWEYLLVPNDLLVHRLRKDGYTGRDPLFISGTDPEEAINANFDTIEQIASDADTSDVEDVVLERVKDLAEQFDSLSVTVYDISSDRETTESEDSVQSSILSSDADSNKFMAVDPAALLYDLWAGLIDKLDRWIVNVCEDRFGARPLDLISRTRPQKMAIGSVFILLLIAFGVGSGWIPALFADDPLRLTVSQGEYAGIIVGLTFSLLSLDRDLPPHRQLETN